MGITVKTAMEIGALKNQKIIAGFTGMKNIIKHVSVIETPDANWFRGQELFLTAFYAVGNDLNAQLNLLQDLKKNNAAALAVCYPGKHYLKLHSQFKELANELSLPVIEIPKDIAYIDIISPIMEKIHKVKESNHIHILGLHEYFPKWIDMGFSLYQITNKLSDYIDKTIGIVNESMDLISLSGKAEQVEMVKDCLFKNKRKFKSEEQLYFNNNYIYITPIQTKQENLGYHVILSKDPIEDISLNIISANLVLYLSHPTAKHEVNAVRKENLINQWFLKNLDINEVGKRAEELNWDIESVVGLALVTTKNNRKFQKELTDKFSEIEWFESMGVLGFFVYKNKLNENGVDGTFEHISSYLNTVTDNFYLAYKEVQVDFLKNGNKTFKHLKRLLLLQKRIPDMKRVVSLDSFPLIEIISGSKSSQSFLKLIEPLKEDMEKSNGELFKTFIHLLFTTNNAEIAKVLHIHRNTLGYRREKIIEKLGENPFDPTLIAQYQMAVFAFYLFDGYASAQ